MTNEHLTHSTLNQRSQTLTLNSSMKLPNEDTTGIGLGMLEQFQSIHTHVTAMTHYILKTVGIM